MAIFDSGFFFAYEVYYRSVFYPLSFRTAADKEQFYCGCNRYFAGFHLYCLGF